ncbi:MAG: hypothetical protein VR65_00455 [Desulfobulbaceae bacterium BRH_c16a]|nr:MAG: hypothetical protein VR65_00455 [Desulfobulbaceae bacterium BRH_c16a]
MLVNGYDLAGLPHSGIMGPMKTPWHYQDIIDLEYFFNRDKDADETELHDRDRSIYLEKQARPGSGGGSTPSRRELIRLWLTARIESDFPGADQRSPGTIFRDTLLLAKNLASLKGVLVGLIAGLSFFSYTGTTPVNVFHFLLLFVVSQVALTILLLCGWLFRLVLPAMKLPSFYSLLFRGMMDRLASFLHKQWLGKLGADKRASFGQAFGIVKARSSVYGSLFYWPLFGLVQLFAVGFNVGLLAATFLKVATSDLAFGWQSTLQLGSEAIHRAVQLAALPWSWLPPLAGSYPSLAEIEGSKIILKEGIYHLATQNLIAWWPFLVLCLIFYGLLLRLALFVLGRMVEARALRHLNLDTADCLALARRMLTPLVSTQAAPERERERGGSENGWAHETAEPQPQTHNLLPQILLIPDDIFGICPAEKLAPLLHNRGLSIKSVHKFMSGYEEDEEIKGMLADSCRGPEEGIFILMEGWMPPLVAFLTYLKELRGILPRKTMIHLGLVGRPVRSGFTPLAPQDLKLWRKKLAAIGDPYLHTFSLTPDRKP